MNDQPYLTPRKALIIRVSPAHVGMIKLAAGAKGLSMQAFCATSIIDAAAEIVAQVDELRDKIVAEALNRASQPLPKTPKVHSH